MLRAFRAGGRRTRATGRELIANLLTGPAQVLTLALIDDVADRPRFMALAAGHPALRDPSKRPATAPSYGQLLAAISVAEEGGTLAALATFHADELSDGRHPRTILLRDERAAANA